MKNIFTKTFMLFTLLSLSIGVWGGQYDLGFKYSQTNGSKTILDSPWSWNKNADYIANSDNNFVALKDGPTATSREQYNFPAGNVTVKLYAHFISNDEIAPFPVKIGTYTCKFDALSKDGPHSNKDYTYEGTINVASAGTYTITVDFPSTDKMKVKNITFDYAGGPTPPPTDYYYHGAKNNWGWDKLTASETNLYAYYGPLQYNGTHEFYIRTAASDTGEKYGCNFTHSGFENTNITNMNSKDSQWDKGDNGNVAIYEGSDNAYYVIIYYPNTDINTDDKPKICASSELPLYTAGGKTIYFDNSTPNWSTCYFRIGRHNHNSATAMTKVSGTANLYKYEVAKYDSYNAFAIANNYSWTGSNSIYTNNDPKFTGSTEYQKYDITTDQTFTLGSTSSGDGVTWYAVEKHDGLLTHKASITAPDGGTITVSYTDINNANQSFTSGDEDLAHTCILTITATPNTGYNLTSLKVNGNNFTSGQTHTLTAHAVITAEFACIQRTITVNSEDNNKGTVSGGGSYCQGSEVQISATPESGYEFDKWQDDITDNPRTITVSDAATYTAYFKEAKVCNQLTIQCEDSYLPLGVVTGGTPSPSSITCYKDGQGGGHSYSSSSHGNGYICIKEESGKEIYFVFDAPEAGTYKFNVWAGENQNMWLNVYTTDGNGDAVTYNAQTYKKKGNKSLGGSESNTQFAAMGDLAVSLPKGRCIIGLYNGWGYPAYDQIVITASSDVFCFETYALTLTDDGNGTAESDQADNTAIPENTEVTITATPNTGYKFVNWTGFSTETDNPFTFTMTEDVSYQANFTAAQQITITATSADPSKGSVTGGGIYYEGATVTLTATPTTGNEFVSWSDGNTENPRVFTASENLTLTATFKKSTKVCTNTFTLPCGDESLVIESLTDATHAKNGQLTGDGTHSAPTTSSDYMCYQNGNENKYLFYEGIDISENTTASIKIKQASFVNYTQAKLFIYSTSGSGSSVSYNGKTYKQLSSHGSNCNGSSWDEPEFTNVSLPAGSYIFAFQTTNWKGFWIEKMTITASDDVFCTEAPAEPDSWHLYVKDTTLGSDLFVDGSKTVALAKEQTYEFKIVKWVANVESDKVWYTDKNATSESAHMTEENHTDWDFSNTGGGSANTKIDAAAAGDYTFTINTTGSFPVVSVTYPASYTATFNMQGHGTQVDSLTHLAAGDKVVAPATPADVTGWHFVGWYKEQTCTTVFDFANETISSNVTIYAKWEEAVTEIAIHMEGGHKNLNISETNQLYVTYEPDDATYGHEIASWVSSNASFVSVSSTGLATAVGSGTATITATTTNGVQAEYDIHVNQPVCDDWYVHLWNGTSVTDYCLTMYDEGTQEMRTESNVRLPSNSASEKITVLCAKGGDTYKADWQIMGVPMVGQQGNCTHDEGAQYYAGQDAVGYFRIFKNSTSENYYIAFQPTYVAMYGLDGSNYTQIEFHNTKGNEYETDIFQVPDGYKTNENYKYYVGTKRAENSDQSPFIYDGKSRNDQLKDVSGLSGDDWGGKYGKFHIFDNSCDANFYCSFIAYKVVDLYNAEELYYRQSCLNTASDKVNFSIPTAPTGYEFTSWTRQDNTYSVKPTDGDWTNYGMWTPYERFNAVWTPITYNITYTDAGTHTNPATYTIEDTPFELQDPQKDGYTFVNWTIGDDVVTEIAAGTTGDLTLTAHWTPTEYHINYTNLGGAENTNPTTYTIESETINFVDPGNRTGYTFNSWDIASIAHGSTGNKTITASWNLVNYSITYHDATTTNPTSYTIESSFDLTAPSARTGFTFLGWYTDAQYTNPITAITAGMHENKDIYAKWENSYCSKTKFIECEDEWLEDLKDKASKAVVNTGHYTNFSGRGFMDYKQPGGETFYFVHLGAATYEFEISRTNVPSGGRLYLYSTNGTGESVTYKSVAYKRISGIDGDVSGGGGTEGTAFTKVTISDVVLSEEGDYLIGLAGGEWSSFDYIKITANSKVFCPEMYTVTFPQPEHGTVTAQIKDGETTITSGTEVPENTVVVFTASNIASGYELVNWTDDSGNELAGAVASFEQKITSDTTVNANIALIQPKYAVTATAGEHGTITSGEDEYREGATVTIVTSPATNYKVGSAISEQVDEFSIDGNNVSFTMPAEAVEVTINFVFDTVHNMIATGTSTNIGSQQGSGSSGSITVTSIIDPTGHFTHNVLDYDYNMPNSGSYCGYSLPTDAGYKPNSKATGLAFWYMADDNVYMEIKVNGDNVFKLSSTNGEWHYVYLETSAVKTGTSFEIWMNYSKGGWSMTKSTGTVLFSEIQATNVTSQEPIVPKVNLTVEKNPDEGGNVTTSPAEITNLEKGTPVTLTASPNTGYRFVNWTVGGEEVSKEAEYTYTVNANTTIIANFVRVYTLTINNDDHGTATVSPNQTKFAEGDEITVISVPNSGYKFKEWLNGSEKQESTEDPYTFTMPASDKTLKVTFEESTQYFDISTAVEGEGTVTMTINDVPTDGQHILEGSQVVLTANANDDSHAFSEWKEDHNKTNPRTITVTESATYTAVFTEAYTVSVELGKPGKEVIGVGKYAGGAQVTLTAVANTEDSQDKPYDLEYQLKEWTVTAGGVDIAAKKSDNPLTFTMPYLNVSLKATFAPVECVDSLIIQCEDINAFIPATAQGTGHDLPLAPHPIPDKDGCGTKTDYYYGWHGDGYYDYRNNTNCEMYYPVFLQAGTYQFSVWAATDDNKNCSINIYKRTDGTPVLTYKAVDYSRIATAAANNSYKKGGESYVTFQEVGTISDIVVETEQLIIVGLHCGSNFGTFDQIKIKGTTKVFCAPLPTTNFVINAGETKEIPVCGVDSLTIYDGGQANNNGDVEVFKQVKYSRTVAALDKWETFAVPYNATSITVQDIPHKDYEEYGIYPIYGFNSSTGKPYPGYFYLEELKGEDATLMGRPFASRWEIVNEQMPKQNVAYIVRFPTAQSDGYFANTRINYKYVSNDAGAGGASVILTGKKNATIIEEDYPGIEEKPTFYFYANNTLANIQLQTSAYILNESGMNFDIVDQPVIPPFHCYVQATRDIKQMYPHLAMRNDGGGTTILMPLTEEDWKSMNAKKVLIDEVIYVVREGKIYTVMGQLVK